MTSKTEVIEAVVSARVAMAVAVKEMSRSALDRALDQCTVARKDLENINLSAAEIDDLEER